MSLTYAQYVSVLSELMVVPSDNADFQAILPNTIDYAEQRIYRELDLLNTVVRDWSSALSSSNRNFTLPNSSGTFVAVNGINVISPAGTTNPDSGTRNPLVPASRDFLDLAWPNSSGSTVPQYFAMITQTTCVVAPWPDAAYQVEVIGTQRPTPLSVSNTSTFLSNNLPDLFVAASMVFASGYLKNFGSQADQAAMSVSWESQTKTLMGSANAEEIRKKFSGSGWTSQSTGGPPSQPPRN